MGIEPTAQAWEAWVLPLYDARAVSDSSRLDEDLATSASRAKSEGPLASAPPASHPLLACQKCTLADNKYARPMIPEKYNVVAGAKLPPVVASAGNGGNLSNTLSTMSRTLNCFVTL
jgi:hypothetical protein